MTEPTITRRSALVAAAWTVPVIAIAAATPAHAASPAGALLAAWDSSEVTAREVYLYAMDNNAIGVNTGFTVTNASQTDTTVILSTTGLSSAVQMVDVGPGLFWSSNEDSNRQLLAGQTVWTRVNIWVNAPQGTIDQVITLTLRSEYSNVALGTASIRVVY